MLTQSTFRRAKPGLAAERAVQLLDGTMQGCKTMFPSMRVFAVIMHRPAHVPFYPPRILPREYVILVQRIQMMMQTEYPDRMATLIFDERDLWEDRKRAFAFGQFFFLSTEGQRLRQILETPLFVASTICSGLQIADLFARTIRLYHELNLGSTAPSNAFETAVKTYYDIARAKTVDYLMPDPARPGKTRRNYGLYEMPLRLFPPPAAPDPLATPDSSAT